MTDQDSFLADSGPLEAGALSPQLVQWTHEALERLFDLAFLDRHARAPCVQGRYANGRAVHEDLQDAIKQLRPPISVPAHSPAWRAYNTLNLRYAQGLSQAEVAAELGLSVRHLKRVQEKPSMPPRRCCSSARRPRLARWNLSRRARPNPNALPSRRPRRSSPPAAISSGWTTC